MLSNNEYKILNKLIKYKNRFHQNEDSFILNDDFYSTLTTKQKSYINAILQKLDGGNLICDLYFINNAEPHIINITNLGLYEYNYYYKNEIKYWTKRFIIAILGALAALIIATLPTLLQKIYLFFIN